MALALLQNYSAVRDTGLSVPFGATGGTAPYVFSLAPNGAGGTINASTGIYLSPVGTTGVDTIVVTDSLAATASGKMSVGLPIQLVADIIEKQLQIPGQVWLFNQKVDIPSDSKTYIAVGVRTHKAFGNRQLFDGSGNSIQSVNVSQMLSVDIFSRSTLPLSDVDKVMMSFASPYAESQMELNSFFCAPIPSSILNVSGIDGPAIPYHLQISVATQYFSTLSVATPYFENFSPPSIVPN